MFVLQKLRIVVSRVDMFSSSGMLRYNEDVSYQTFTGGIFSLGIILTVIAGFFSMISETVNRTAITSNLNIIGSGNPPPYNVTTNSENMFMFGVQIQSMDLSFYYDMNGPRRYFDVKTISYQRKYGYLEGVNNIAMVQCTDDHWKMIPELVTQKDMLAYNTWLCPQIDAKFLIEGSLYSTNYKYIEISVGKCTNASNPSRPCYPQDQIDGLFEKYGNFYFTLNYINTVINPDEVNYKSYYIEAMEYAMFSADLGNEMYWLFSDYKIETDSSIWPYSNFQSETGISVPSKPAGLSYSINSDSNYVSAYFAKSIHSLSYRRQVQKLSVVFSYIGGLIGAASAVMFIIKLYTDTSLEISIAKSLFQDKQKVFQNTEQLKSNNDEKSQREDSIHQTAKNEKGFSLMTFIKLHAYNLFNKFRCAESWNESSELKQFRDEIGKHLDVKNVLRRIINLQRYLSYVFDEKQLACLRHQQSIKFSEIKRLRKLFTQQSDQEEVNQIEQSNISCNNIYKVSNIACNQIIIASPAQHFALQSPSQLQNPVKMTLPKMEVQNFRNRHKIIHMGSKNKVEQIGVVDHSKIRQYFTDMKISGEKNIISRRIWQNANKNFIQTQKNSSGPSKINEDLKKSFIQAILITQDAFE